VNSTLLKPDLYVVARFLDVLLWDTSGMKKTQLQMSVGLNYQNFLKYLEWLEQHGLVKIMSDDDGNDRITLSKKGMDAHKRLVEWIKETMKGLKI
jgi:predicted transcriptional regulator